MTEDLKTLKDIADKGITFECEMLCDVNSKEFRAEAIKHYKRLEGQCESWNANSEIMRWIKHFFNISEEEIK